MLTIRGRPGVLGKKIKEDDPLVIVSSVYLSAWVPSYSIHVHKYCSHVFCQVGSEAVIQLLPGSMCPVRVSANTFILLSSWETSLSCPSYFPSRFVVFDLALAWSPALSHLLQTFTCPLSLDSPKFTCMAAPFLQRTCVDFYHSWSFMPMRLCMSYLTFSATVIPAWQRPAHRWGWSEHAPCSHRGFPLPREQDSFRDPDIPDSRSQPAMASAVLRHYPNVLSTEFIAAKNTFGSSACFFQTGATLIKIENVPPL